MPQGGALGRTCKYTTACNAVTFSSASRHAKSVGHTCGGGTAVSMGTHAHARCIGILWMHVSTHMTWQAAWCGMMWCVLCNSNNGEMRVHENSQAGHPTQGM